MAGSFTNRQKVIENVIPTPLIPGPAAAPIIYPGEIIPTPAADLPSPLESVRVESNTIKSTFDSAERVAQIRNDENTGEKEFSVGYYDIDEAIGYYIENVIQPTVIENGEVIPVPIMYGYPERWAEMQNFGFYRDNKSKIILPFLMYRRTTVARNENIIFPRVNQLYYVAARKWDSKDRYDNVYARNVKSLTNKYSLVSLPNYVVITYEGILWTSFVEQMNKIVEKFQFADNTYWGDPKKFKFRAQIDSIDTATELVTDTERMVRATFSITIYGYILTDAFNNAMTTRIQVGPKRVVFGEMGQTRKPTLEHPYKYDAENSSTNYDFSEDSTPNIDLNNLP